MREGERRRRFRVRRKSRGSDLAEGGTDVVAEFGCCLIEPVASAAILSAVLVPAFHWSR